MLFMFSGTFSPSTTLAMRDISLLVGSTYRKRTMKIHLSCRENRSNEEDMANDSRNSLVLCVLLFN